MVGVNAKNKNFLEKKFLCSVCLLVLCDPVQLTECGHRLCQSCINTQHGATIKCPECSTETQRNQIIIDQGFKRDMQLIPIECYFCRWTGIFNTYQEHLDESHRNPKCEYCDKRFNSVGALNQHHVLECQKITIECVLKNFGCNEPIMRGKVEEHYLTQQHQDATLKVLRQKLELQMNIDVSPTTTNETTLDPVIDEQKKLYETINILADGIEALNDDGQRLNDELLQNQIKLQTLIEDISKVQLSVEESYGFLQGVKYNQDILHQDLASLKQKIDDMQHTSYDGTFVWKITNFREKMMDAQSERQTSIYSPPFYSSPTGYKMRARLYLHGDGTARRTHMSIFFVLMRSLNDPILKFPFNYKVTFCMYDQSGAGRHIIDSFRPDIRSNSFQRPRSDMNIASGIPKFFPLSMIQEEGNPYVRDDAMFIKIIVDFDGMAKTLLPYALSLNPGLPAHIQQAMVKTETERRSQQ